MRKGNFDETEYRSMCGGLWSWTFGFGRAAYRCGTEKMVRMMLSDFAVRFLNKFAQVALPKTLTL